MKSNKKPTILIILFITFMFSYVLVITSSTITTTSTTLSSRVICDTTKGKFVIQLHPEWAPLGVSQVKQLLQADYYSNIALFRVVKGFLVQFGIHANQTTDRYWNNHHKVKDDPLWAPRLFKRGMVAFAGGGADSRTTHLFISYSDSKHLGTQPWEAPIGEVVEGMDEVVEQFFEVGDMPPWGKGPPQHKIHELGYEYLKQEFPLLDYLIHCKLSESLETMTETAIYNKEEVQQQQREQEREREQQQQQQREREREQQQQQQQHEPRSKADDLDELSAAEAPHRPASSPPPPPPPPPLSLLSNNISVTSNSKHPSSSSSSHEYDEIPSNSIKQASSSSLSSSLSSATAFEVAPWRWLIGIVISFTFVTLAFCTHSRVRKPISKM